VKKLSIRQAMLQALLEEMKQDETVFLWGEGMRSKVAFDYPELLKAQSSRVYSMPISEASIVGAALGAALVGLRPVVDLSFDDLVPRAMDEILNDVAKVRYVTGGESRPRVIIKFDLPPVRCAQTGQRLESLFLHIPGLVVAVPSTPSDAKGLMKASLRAGGPVILVEDRWITTHEEVPEGDYEVPFGKAALRKEGNDVTILTYGYMVSQALDAAKSLSAEGIIAEVVDLRSLAPLDLDLVFSSVKRTGRVVIVEGGWRTCGVGAELSALIVESCMEELESPPARLAMKMTHIPTTSALRMKVFPSNDDIRTSVMKLMRSRVVVHG
jgi:pyruvate dehydrogenase E1 component beta subunit